MEIGAIFLNIIARVQHVTAHTNQYFCVQTAFKHLNGHVQFSSLHTIMEMTCKRGLTCLIKDPGVLFTGENVTCICMRIMRLVIDLKKWKKMELKYTEAFFAEGRPTLPSWVPVQGPITSSQDLLLQTPSCCLPAIVYQLASPSSPFFQGWDSQGSPLQYLNEHPNHKI